MRARLKQQCQKRPPTRLNKKYRPYQFLMASGKIVSGFVVKEEPAGYHVITNLLDPRTVTRLHKANVYPLENFAHA